MVTGHPWRDMQASAQQAGVSIRNEVGQWRPRADVQAEMPAKKQPWEIARDQYVPALREGMSPEEMDARSRLRREWDNSAAAAVSRGDIVPSVAAKRGLRTPPQDKWATLPDTLYHVTTAKAAVLQAGLKTRSELGQDLGRGGLWAGASRRDGQRSSR